MDKSNVAFPQLRAAFALYNRTTNKSPRTVSWYDERLRGFERFVGTDASLADATVDRYRAFIAHLQDRTHRHDQNRYVPTQEGPLSSSYIQGFARALRGLQ